MSRKLAAVMLAMAALLALMITSAVAQEAGKKEDKPAHAFVGHAKCKLCHKTQHTSWLETKHAKAYDVLSAEDQRKPECVKCHITGTTAEGELLTGVQCEACHGAGSDYKSAQIMSKKKWAADPEGQKKLAIEAGLVFPTEANCVRCHTKEGNPNFKPFDFAKSKPLVHKFGKDEAATE